MSLLSRPLHPVGRRVWNKVRRYTNDHYGRRDFRLRTETPYVSFTFDDFPRSALVEGGRLLVEHGVRGTYFVSGKMVGGPSPSGPIASWLDVKTAVAEGHELGCHTFDHLDGCESTVAAFDRSIAANRATFSSLIEAFDAFETFAYPLDGPVLPIKRAVGARFTACRGGGQATNVGDIDLNLLKAYFFDARSDDRNAVRRLVEENAAQRGWLIFATHDVSRNPSRFGCTPSFFDEALQCSLRSGARVLPMADVLRQLGVPGLGHRTDDRV